MTHKKLVTTLKKHMASLTKERDSLRNLLLDIEALEDVVTRAYDDLESAVETLSEQV